MKHAGKHANTHIQTHAHKHLNRHRKKIQSPTFIKPHKNKSTRTKALTDMQQQTHLHKHTQKSTKPNPTELCSQEFIQ